MAWILEISVCELPWESTISNGTPSLADNALAPSIIDAMYGLVVLITEATRTRSSFAIVEEAPPELVVDVHPDNAIAAAAATAVTENHFLENLLLDISTHFSFEQGKAGGTATLRIACLVRNPYDGLEGVPYIVGPISRFVPVKQISWTRRARGWWPAH